MSRLSQKIALVTGAAGGMGQGIALKLAAEGAQVALFDLKDCAQTAGAIADRGGRCQTYQGDVTDEAALASLAADLTTRHGRLDILVNNAGKLSHGKPWSDYSAEEFLHYLDINCVGYFRVAKALLPLLKASSAGRVINVASRTFYLANPGHMAYVASKGAVIGMTRVLARELGADGITVNAVAPGMIETPGTQAFVPAEAFDTVMKAQAIQRLGAPADMAKLVAFLASDEADMITGQMIVCDGGGLMH